MKDPKDAHVYDLIGIHRDAVDLIRRKRPELAEATEANITEVLAEAVIGQRSKELDKAAETMAQATKVMLECFGQFVKVAKACQDGVGAQLVAMRDKRMALTTELAEATKVVQGFKDLVRGQDLKEGVATVNQMIDLFGKAGTVPQQQLKVLADALIRMAHNA